MGIVLVLAAFAPLAVFGPIIWHLTPTPPELPADDGCTCGYDPCLAPGLCYLIES